MATAGAAASIAGRRGRGPIEVGLSSSGNSGFETRLTDNAVESFAAAESRIDATTDVRSSRKFIVTLPRGPNGTIHRVAASKPPQTHIT